MVSVSLRRSILACKFKYTVRMTSHSSYEQAIHKLNCLQSNKATIEQIKQGIKSGQNKCTNLEDMEDYLNRIGFPLTKLDELSVIHVAGTKGKGSTSAMCESILRHHGYRTGFYSSPHLVAARERIRLDGVPLSREQFATYLHTVYTLLENSQKFEGDMPKYFAFLTVMAFHVFLRERVDVAVVEVGIGGVVDYTNVLRKVPVVGITALGLDHTSILGSTLPEIAAAKAGVMKRGCDAYTVAQPAPAMDVLAGFADNVKCPLTVAPDYSSYTFPKTDKSHLPVDLDAYKTNASLAIQLAHAWMRGHSKKSLNGIGKGQNGLTKVPNETSFKENGQNGVTNVPNGYSPKIENSLINGNILGKLVYDLPYKTMEGLRNCKWPGRYHVVDSDYATFYLDGAHTKESMEICAKWFADKSNKSSDSILIFSATGDRNAEILLQPLMNMPFKQAFFVIPTAHKVTSSNNDNFSLMEQELLIERCKNHSQIWRKSSNSDITVLECVSDALQCVKNGKKAAVLITGSLHLVGAALSILDPNLST